MKRFFIVATALISFMGGFYYGLKQTEIGICRTNDYCTVPVVYKCREDITMSSVVNPLCPKRVTQWADLAIKWSRLTGVHAALILAIIDQESDGDQYAFRNEPKYLDKLKSTEAGRRKLKEIYDKTKITNPAASYGLMQPLFTVAYGYGARSVDDLHNPDKNIRYCSAHLRVLQDKYHTVAATAGAYNGAGPKSKYAQDVVILYNKYKKFLETYKGA